MTMKAKYPGRCRECGRPIRVGDEIDWSPDGGAYHAACQASPQRPSGSTGADAPYALHRGSGSGHRAYAVGQTIQITGHRPANWPEWVTVVRARQEWVPEEGLSMGVGADEGYVYEADCRAATEQEIAAAMARRELRTIAKATDAERQACIRRVRSSANHVTTGPSASGETIPIDPKGRETWWIGPAGIWITESTYDDHHAWRVDYDPALEADIRRLFGSAKKETSCHATKS